MSAFQTRDEQGLPVGIGWRPRFTLNLLDSAANNGLLTSYTVNENVQGGREFLYSVVTKTRSFLATRSVISDIRSSTRRRKAARFLGLLSRL